MAIDKVLNKNVAIKIEQTSAKKQVLKLEVVVLKKFQGKLLGTIYKA